MKKISILIPFYNEEKTIDELVLRLNEFLTNKEYDPEVIFIDDGSTDNSFKLLKSKNIKFKSKIIKLSKNFGSHPATRAGLKVCSGNYAIALPSDLQDPLELIDQSYASIKDKSMDVIYCQRKSTQNSFLNSLFSNFYSFLMKRYVNKNYPKMGFDVVMISRKIIDLLNINIEDHSNLQLQILNLGFSFDKIYYDKKKRHNGKSKWTINKKLKLFIDSFIGFSLAPIRFVTIIGLILFLIGIIWTIQIIVYKFLIGDIVQGWTALSSILFLGFGITNLSLGILAEYIWRNLEATRNRPVFIIDEIFETKINS